MNKYYAESYNQINSEIVPNGNPPLLENTLNQSFSQYSLDTNLDFFEIYSIMPGFSMVTGNHYSEKGLSIAFKSQDNNISFCYCISGTKEVKFKEKKHDCQSENIISGGHRVVSFFPKIEGVKELAPHQHHSMATIIINPTLLHHYTRNDSNLVSIGIKKLLKGESFNYYKKDTTPMPLQTIAYQILNCPFKNGARQLFMKSKALELLSFQIEDMSKTTKSAYDKVNLNANDIDLIYIAKDLLLENIDDAPTLPQLAKLTGISLLKLKAGFKRVYGISVHSYLQQYRIEKAKYLIENKRLNVSEIAWRVGYTNVSHFIAAYRKRYGVNPGSCLKEKRRELQMLKNSSEY